RRRDRYGRPQRVGPVEERDLSPGSAWPEKGRGILVNRGDEADGLPGGRRVGGDGQDGGARGVAPLQRLQGGDELPAPGPRRAAPRRRLAGRRGPAKNRGKPHDGFSFSDAVWGRIAFVGRPGAQTERRGGLGPVSGLLGGSTSPATFVCHFRNQRPGAEV